jgi:ABC-2 type transport system ATP-binding protein
MNLDIVIKTEGLTKIYKDFFGRPKVTALKDLSIQIHKGELFGIIGPNGSGKTTIMKLLLGLIFPTSGKAYVLGENPTNVRIKSRIGFLPEESYLYGFLNADETLDLFARLFNISYQERKKRIDYLLNIFGLEGARKRLIKEYSKGMQKKVSFSQALINDPDVIFLDEPTSGLDPISTRQIKDLLIELKNKGKTIFLSSHLLADVQDICDRIAILHEGTLRRCGSVRELLINKDFITITCSGLSWDVIDRLKQLINHEGGRIVSCDHTLENLESLFLRTVKEGEDKPIS